MCMIAFRKAFYADVRTEGRSRTTISYQAGVLEEMKTREERRAFLRVYNGRMWYYASVTDLAHLQNTLDGLYAAATPNAQIADDPVVRRLERNRDRVMRFADCSVRDIPAGEKQALLQAYLPLLNEDACVTMPRGACLDRSSVFHFESSLGADITYDYQTCGVSFSGHWQKGATRCDELKGLEEENRAAMAEPAAFMRQSVPVTPGKYPVVLSPEAAGVFAHESFGHKSESDFMLSDETMRDEWQLGKTVGSPILSIAEWGGVPGSGYVPYDDEGTKARKNYLIKNGVLTGRLHSA